MLVVVDIIASWMLRFGWFCLGSGLRLLAWWLVDLFRSGFNIVGYVCVCLVCGWCFCSVVCGIYLVVCACLVVARGFCGLTLCLLLVAEVLGHAAGLL